MKFNIYTLGCKVNTYESNVMIDKMKNAGFIQVSTSEMADISIINTCTVTNMADSKSAKIIRQAKRKNEKAIIVVCGCLVQNEIKFNKENIEADIIIGNIGKSKIVSYINEYLKTKKPIFDVKNIMNTEFEEMTLNNFNRTRAFVKIQDGCNNFCSYCVIPYTRGNVRSKKREDVLKEVNNLVLNGHKEIVLTGIHTGNYGAEFEDYKFADLLNDLVKIKGLERIRISSIEMNELNIDVLNVIKNNKVIVNHIHIPIQSGSNTVLKRMNRKYNKEEFISKIEEIRKLRPDVSITTDLIVGFPGETEEEFAETIDTINKIKFSKIHVFPYSKRDKTEAATFSNQVDEKIKKDRTHKILELSKKLEIDYMNKFLGKDVTFIPEVYRDGYLIGHTGNYLNIKMLGNEEDLHKDIDVKIELINYPYCLAREKK